MVNSSIDKDYTLVSFNVQNLKQTQNLRLKNSRCDLIPKASSFYCNISYGVSQSEIFFFDNQCYILSQHHCLPTLLKTCFSNEKNEVINYLKKNFYKKNKSCGFENVTFIPPLTEYISTTG
jgi:hypothetical protein